MSYFWLISCSADEKITFFRGGSQRLQQIRNIDDQYRVRRAHCRRWSCVRRLGLVRSIGRKGVSLSLGRNCGMTFNERYGPRALVTGASSGIGAEFARQLGEIGLNVAIVAWRRPRLEELAYELEAKNRVLFAESLNNSWPPNRRQRSAQSSCPRVTGYTPVHTRGDGEHL
jgi:hypothetical protein